MSIDNNGYFIALSGAKKNVGDFLITERALALLRHISPANEYLLRPNWLELDDFNLVNNSKGIIILGGPGYQMNMYPGTYKLAKELEDIQVPIYILGGGWYGRPGDKTTEKLYTFTKSAKKLLSKVNLTVAGLSCRDYQTKRVLERNGFRNSTMTGCPVWYHIPSLGKEFKAPRTIDRIVFTPAQNPLYQNQTIETLGFLRAKFPQSEIVVSFHRGLGVEDEFTSRKDAENTRKIASYAESLEIKAIDTSFDVEKLTFYDECDLHVGYRVHAHIYFLSKRLPSILLHEDGRGTGVTEALGSPGVNAYVSPKLYSAAFSKLWNSRFIARAYTKIGLKVNMNLVDELDATIASIRQNNFSVFENVSQRIDSFYPTMEDFIIKLTKC